MGTPYIAMYPSDYLADTAHLGLTEHGVYWRMLLHYYQHGKPLPNDLDRICRLIIAITPEEKRVVDFILSEFFHLQNDDGVLSWHHHRADKEISIAQGKHLTNSMKAKKAAEARWGNSTRNAPSMPQAMPQAMHKQCQPEPEPEEDKNLMPGKPDDAEIVLAFLNKSASKNFKPVKANIDLINARLKEGYTVEELHKVIAKKASQWLHDDKFNQYLRPSTLFSREKCAQYSGELGQAKQESKHDWI